MLGKVLGLVTAGVFVGAVAAEVSGILGRDRVGKEPCSPDAMDQDVEAPEEHDQTAPQVRVAS